VDLDRDRRRQEARLVWFVGRRDYRDCYVFLTDLRSRIAPERIQLATNGLMSYPSTIQPLFGSDRLDYSMLIQMFGRGDYDLRSSPPAYIGIEHRIITGDPDPERISTCYLSATT